jgi:hypothetical protein
MFKVQPTSNPTMSTRSTRKNKKTINATRKKQEDLNGFYRRMSEPFRPEPYHATPEEIKKWNDKYGPMLTGKQRMQRFIMKTSKPYKPKPLPVQEDDYVPSWKKSEQPGV